MPIVKKKTIIHDLQEATEFYLGKKQFTKSSLHSLTNELSITSAIPENETRENAEVIIKQENFELAEAVEIEVDVKEQHVEKQVLSDVKRVESISQFRSLASKIASSCKNKIKENDEKIKQIGLATLKLLDNAETGSQVDKLIQRMRVSRKVLSYERTKLLVVLRRFKRYQTQNTQLDCQMQDVSLKQYYELKSELNRIGEKLEENNKRMNRSRQQFENDVARSTHVREKLFDFQNRLMIVLRDVCDVQQNLYAFKQVLCENLERKKKLRKENEKLKLYTTIGKLKPWYKQTNNEIISTKSCIAKFN